MYPFLLFINREKKSLPQITCVSYHHRWRREPGSPSHCSPHWIWTGSTASWNGRWKQWAVRMSGTSHKLSQSWEELCHREIRPCVRHQNAIKIRSPNVISKPHKGIKLCPIVSASPHRGANMLCGLSCQNWHLTSFKSQNMNEWPIATYNYSTLAL